MSNLGHDPWEENGPPKGPKLSVIVIAIVTLLLILLVNGVSAEETHEWRTTFGIGGDPSRSYVAIQAGRDWMPRTHELNWGVKTLMELGRYDYNGTGIAVTAGAAPVVTWRGLYAGLGGSVGNTTPYAGTAVNFMTMMGYDYAFDWGRIGAFINHRSHCSKCGIAEDEENGGVTTYGVQAVFTW